MTKKFCMVFPGQGSQSVGMLADLAEHYPSVRATFNEASEVLGFDLWQLVGEGPAEDLNQTHNTQPAMLASGVAVWRVWQESGGARPEIMAGHSLGEYSALVCADALSFSDAVALVAERGRLMQAAVPAGKGAMAAILGLEDDEVRRACSDASSTGVVEAVNFNSPGQVVIAGEKTAVDAAVENAKQAGAKRAVLLPVSVPSHCALMRTAAQQLAQRLATITIESPRTPVIHNMSVTSESDPARIREALTAQLYSPVRWVETIGAMKAAGADVVIEAGPGKVLSGLVKRIDKTMTGLAVFDTGGVAAALEELR